MSPALRHVQGEIDIAPSVQDQGGVEGVPVAGVVLDLHDLGDTAAGQQDDGQGDEQVHEVHGGFLRNGSHQRDKKKYYHKNSLLSIQKTVWPSLSLTDIIHSL